MAQPPVFAKLGEACAKCGDPITKERRGRRYRMQPVHETCLPETRQKKIKMQAAGELHDADA